MTQKIELGELHVNILQLDIKNFRIRTNIQRFSDSDTIITLTLHNDSSGKDRLTKKA